MEGGDAAEAAFHLGALVTPVVTGIDPAVESAGGGCSMAGSGAGSSGGGGA